MKKIIRLFGIILVCSGFYSCVIASQSEEYIIVEAPRIRGICQESLGELQQLRDLLGTQEYKDSIGQDIPTKNIHYSVVRQLEGDFRKMKQTLQEDKLPTIGISSNLLQVAREIRDFNFAGTTRYIADQMGAFITDYDLQEWEDFSETLSCFERITDLYKKVETNYTQLIIFQGTLATKMEFDERQLKLQQDLQRQQAEREHQQGQPALTITSVEEGSFGKRVFTISIPVTQALSTGASSGVGLETLQTLTRNLGQQNPFLERPVDSPTS